MTIRSGNAFIMGRPHFLGAAATGSEPSAGTGSLGGSSADPDNTPGDSGFPEFRVTTGTHIGKPDTGLAPGRLHPRRVAGHPIDASRFACRDRIGRIY